MFLGYCLCFMWKNGLVLCFVLCLSVFVFHFFVTSVLGMLWMRPVLQTCTTTDTPHTETCWDWQLTTDTQTVSSHCPAVCCIFPHVDSFDVCGSDQPGCRSVYPVLCRGTVHTRHVATHSLLSSGQKGWCNLDIRTTFKNVISQSTVMMATARTLQCLGGSWLWHVTGPRKHLTTAAPCIWRPTQVFS